MSHQPANRGNDLIDGCELVAQEAPVGFSQMHGATHPSKKLARLAAGTAQRKKRRPAAKSRPRFVLRTRPAFDHQIHVADSCEHLPPFVSIPARMQSDPTGAVAEVAREEVEQIFALLRFLACGRERLPK
jgi:hypothetical protein